MRFRLAALLLAVLCLPADAQILGLFSSGGAGGSTGGGGTGVSAYLSAVSTILPVANGSSVVNTTIPNGSSALLTWDSVGAASCTSPDIPAFPGTVSGTATVSPTSSTTYHVACSGNNAAATVTVSGTLRDAAAAYCAANGGGNGSSGSPWHTACIQAAVNAASAGDTIYLQGGNWALSTADSAPVTINAKVINLVGAGSGNTFDAWGHVNNSSGADLCPTAGTAITCVMMVGTSTVVNYGVVLSGAGYVFFGDSTGHPSSTCGGTIANIFFDGSQATLGGDARGLLSIYGCGGPTVINNIRILAMNPSVFSNFNTQFSPIFPTNLTVYNSVMADPLASSGLYSSAQTAQFTGGNGYGSNVLMDNNVFYMGSFNVIYTSFVTYTRNIQYGYTDALGATQVVPEGLGPAGSGMGGSQSVFCFSNGQSGQCNGDFNFTISNNLFYGGTTSDVGLGAGVNDPTTSGGINNINWTGNWSIARNTAIDSCVWHLLNGHTGCVRPLDATFTGASVSGTTLTFSGITGSGAGGDFLLMNAPGLVLNTKFSGACTTSPCTLNTSNPSIGPATMYAAPNAVVGMAVNTAVDSSCNESNGGGTFNITNNSLIGTTTAQLNSEGDPIAGIGCKMGTFPVTGNTPIPIQVYGFSAQKNYLNSPSNQYITNANSISPVQSGNYCNSAAGTVTGCATSGFTTPPTCSFTLGVLSNGTVQIATESFTAQYGAVQWLTSTNSATPLSSDTRWISNNSFFASPSAVAPPVVPNSYIPPVYLSGVSHGNIVYMWTMDSASNIGSCGSVAVP